MSFVDRLSAAARATLPALRKIAVEERYLRFDAPLEEPDRYYPPSQSDSKFQAEQALGDWAENSVLAAINRGNAGVFAVHYGDNSKLFAEDDGFREEFIAGARRTYREGKRSDLLLLPQGVDAPEDCTGLSAELTAGIVRSCIGGLEIRSSRLNADQYRRYQAQRRADGHKPASLEPSVTVKIEDLLKVYRWNSLNGKPQAYVQVFFDEVHGISFLEILEYIGSAPKLRVEKHKRSDKTTIMIPLSRGRLLGRVTESADFEVVHNVTRNGRHDIFAQPIGGRIELDVSQVRALLE